MAGRDVGPSRHFFVRSGLPVFAPARAGNCTEMPVTDTVPGLLAGRSAGILGFGWPECAAGKYFFV